MDNIKEQLSFFADICANPRRQLDKALAEGKKAVGILPYFCPEELVYAGGMLPFGLWGGELQTDESKRYFPAFVCSLLHTTLEMGIRGMLNGLSAVMIPACCDSLKCMGANWEYGVKDIPVIPVAYAQNRRLEAGVEFTRSQFQKIRLQLEKLAGHVIEDHEIAQAIDVYNRNRSTLLAFSGAAARHPQIITPAERSAVLKAGYFMDRAAHTEAVLSLLRALEDIPEQPWDGFRIITTGIIADAPEILRILEENHMAVIDDQVAHESVNFGYMTPVTDDPVLGMARRLSQIENCSILFDPQKKRGKALVERAKALNADGIIWIMTKFCDPEEFDYVPVKRMIDSAGIPLLTVESDQQMLDYGQARSAAEAFRERLEALRTGRVPEGGEL